MLPDSSPFTLDQRKALDSLLAGFDVLQRGWLSGFLAAGSAAVISAPSGASASAGKLTVLYGTESGNSEELADRAVKEAKKKGFKAVMKNMADISPADLAKVENLLVIVSTWGDGEAPETAVSFHKSFMSEGFDLTGVKFSVCALGDTSYEKFCEIGKQFDARLEQLGASRVAPRVDCDVDYEDSYNEWFGAAMTALAPAAPASVSTAAPATFAPATTEYGKKNPFPAEVIDNVLLNGEGSSKETIHAEFSLEGSGLVYEPGDALAVLPTNCARMVEEILDAAKLKGTEEVEVKGLGKRQLAVALADDYDITALSKAVLKKLAEATGSEKLNALLADGAKDQLREYIEGREIIDAIEDFAPTGLSAQALAGILRKLPVRLYSIASSPLAHPDEVHLTVAAVRYESHGRIRKGVCSTFLADVAKTGESVPVFVQPNKNFRLPADHNTPIIMVGPGTGVAPFRSFVEHRAALGAPGKSWLFFGDQHYTYDFLYQLEWQGYLKDGALTKLDLAFSRDQPEKVYVQDKMLEKGEELYAWLEEGAHFYVCGDASRMAADVHEALIGVVQNFGAKSREEAELYVENLKKSKRYQRDVY
ncbi:assimilatory sulfite reductase (NADPH) flavoprotein subunit [Luteolibacter algae]|uniref:Assimilatory sulfite reductase (NADPH) flavoprotein subunit n=1 Tax=Luteolibacter algae TaxID=454151 RepID=A0ABW5DC62_9BACT